MPTIQSSVSVAGNATNENILTGSQYEFLPYNAHVEFGLVGSATGLVADVYSGSDTVAESFGLSAANHTPVYPDDFTLNDVAAGGERLKVRVRNTTGGALTCFYSVRITPFG
jgi:hypothetical protein